jgi:hypothetical protein
MSELQKRYDDLEKQKEGLNPNNGDDQFIIKRIENEQEGILEQLKQEKIDQKDGEMQELVRGYDFNKIFGDTEANKMVHGLLMTVTKEHLAQLEERDKKIEVLTKQGMDAEDKARENNELLNAALEENAKLYVSNTKLEDERDELVAQIGKLMDELEESKNGNEDITKLQESFEDERKESRRFRNENAALQLKLNNLINENSMLRKQKEEFARDTNLDEVAQRIQERTNQKKQLTNIRQIDKNTYEGTNEQGEVEQFPWFAKNAYEEVPAFPLPSVGGEPHQENIEEVQGDLETFPKDEVEGLQQDDESEDQRGEGPGVGTHEEGSAEVGEVTREEFESLKNRVNYLYDHANISGVA